MIVFIISTYFCCAGIAYAGHEYDNKKKRKTSDMVHNFFCGWCMVPIIVMYGALRKADK